MATTLLADNPAAVAAGWVRTQWPNQGTGTFTTRYSKHVTGDDGTSGHAVELDASGATQVAAGTAALAALNGWRANRYGVDTTAKSKAPKKGGGSMALVLRRAS